MKKYRILPLLLIVCLLLTAAFPVFAANSTASTAEQSPEPTANAASDGVPQSMVQAQEGSYVLGSDTVKSALDKQLQANCVMLVDEDSGQYYYTRNIDAKAYPASLTKIMTLLLAVEAVERGDVHLDDTVTAYDDCNADMVEGASNADIKVGETMTFEDFLYCAMISSANEACNVVAEYVCGSISAFVERMNTRAQELGCTGTHFANPHGISDEDHYTSCYDMAQILRWALTQPGFETLFTRNEMYTMGPTNVQPVTRYFHQQDKMRVGSSRYYIPAILGSKIGYTNIARYSYVCLAEQNGVRLICVTMQSQIKTDKYNDVRTLLDDAFARCTGYTEIPAQGVTGELEVAGGGSTLGTVTVSDPGVKLLLADGLSAADVSVTLELPERYLLGVDPAVYAVYTIHGRDVQETASVRVPAAVTGLEELLAKSANATLPASRDVGPKRIAGGLLAISVGATVLAALAAFGVVRLRIKWKKRKSKSKH